MGYSDRGPCKACIRAILAVFLALSTWGTQRRLGCPKRKARRTHTLRLFGPKDHIIQGFLGYVEP